MNESEQAQAIAEIRAAHDLDMHFVGNLEDTVILQLLCHRKDLLEIVDSQAQKITEARAEAEKWRQATIGYKYGNQWTQEGFALNESEKLPWEKR